MTTRPPGHAELQALAAEVSRVAGVPLEVAETGGRYVVRQPNAEWSEPVNARGAELALRAFLFGWAAAGAVARGVGGADLARGFKP